jgi:hypothetical protein
MLSARCRDFSCAAWFVASAGCQAEPPKIEAAPAVSGKHSGRYSARATNPGGQGDYTADVTITASGAYYTLNWKIGKERSYTGVGLEIPGFLAVGWGHAGYRVFVYEVTGKEIVGRWAAADNQGKVGSEVLEGPQGLNGSYRIARGYDPARDASYEGMVSIAPNGAVYRLQRSVRGHVLGGVGIKKGSRLIVGAGPGGGAGVMVYTLQEQGLSGQWAQPTSNLLGTEYLSRR